MYFPILLPPPLPLVQIGMVHDIVNHPGVDLQDQIIYQV